jgi:hypothetical protein
MYERVASKSDFAVVVAVLSGSDLHQTFSSRRLSQDESQQHRNNDSRDADCAQRDPPTCASFCEGGSNLPAYRLTDVHANVQYALSNEDVSPPNQVADETDRQRLDTSLPDAHCQPRAKQLCEVLR